VRIVRFDEEVSMSITDFGSKFKMGPLTRWDSTVRVQVMYLPPGGSIGRHQAVSHQLFAVVAGSGTASGADAEWATLVPGYGALWEAGEFHEAHSNGGLTAICIEGEFEVSAIWVTNDIVVSDYDPEWPDRFESLRERIWPQVEDLAIRVDHIGSTAVPGLAAKPIIDMDIVVPSTDEVRPVIDQLAATGYSWRGDLGIAGREALWPTSDEQLPLHNLYVVVENNRAHLDHWLLRDMLRENPEARDRYGELKKRNAELAGNDMDVYVRAKAALVAELLTEARQERGLPPVDYWEPEVQPPPPSPPPPPPPPNLESLDQPPT
jgi:GrpB-like predicted nucleotidyltransferase (UPF0157 family)